MKKKHLGLFAATAVVLGVGIASAQQRPPHVTLPTPPDNLKSMRFPTSAANYDKFVQWYLTLIRSMPQRFHITQGESDLLVLHLKDCAGRIEADNVVTKSEANYCTNSTMAKVQEVLAPYIAQQAGGENN
jgi:hypothetical protein